MEKEKLSTELKTLAGQTSHSQQTWDSYIENVVIPFAPTEEDKLPEYLKRHAEYLKTQNGQYGKDVADLTNTQVASKVEEFKKNYKPNTTQTTQTNTVVDPNDEIAKKLKELDDFKKSLEQRHESDVKTAKITEKRNSVLSKLKEQGADNLEILEFVELSLSIDEDSDVNSLLSKGIELYNDKYSRVYRGEVSPAHSFGTSTAIKKNTRDAYLKHLQETGRIPKSNTN